MKITLNNRKEIFKEENITINDLLRIKNYSFKFIITTVNGKLVKKPDRDKFIINDGDIVNTIHLISGG